MGIFDIFTAGQQQAQQPVQQLPQPGNMQDPATVAADSNVAAAPGTAPAADPANADSADSPLAEFASLWDTVAKPDDKGGAKAPVLTQEAVAKVMAKRDFSQAVDPALLHQITAGGEGAETALSQALNSVAQQVMTQSTLINNKLSQEAIAREVKAQVSKMPEAMRLQAVTNQATTTNPVFNDPAVKPVMQAVTQQLTAKFPEASHAQIVGMAQNFAVTLGEAFAPAPAPDPAAAQGTDWGAFLDMDQ